MRTNKTTLAGERTRKWKRGKYKVALNPRCTYAQEQGDTRKGYVLDNTFGIDSQMHNVTHLPTGLKLPGYFTLLRDAKAYAEALFPLTDWLTITQDNAAERFAPIKPTILNLMQKHGI